MNRIKMIILAALASCTLSNFAAQKQEFDLLIKGGKVYDGSGNPWFYADIGISDNTIVAVGKLQNASARQMIDAKGRYVVPGMIDLHTHADEGSQPEAGLRSEDPRRRAAPNIVSQGVTTVVINHDGRSAWPIRQQIAEIRAKGIGPNAILLFGHGEVRQQVMNDDFRRPATVGEIVAMQELARQAMGEGAFGMSAGLEYVPGRWSRTDELIEIMKVVAKYGGCMCRMSAAKGGSDVVLAVARQCGPADPVGRSDGNHRDRRADWCDSGMHPYQVERCALLGCRSRCHSTNPTRPRSRRRCVGGSISVQHQRLGWQYPADSILGIRPCIAFFE